MKTLALIIDTFREIYSRKAILGMIVIEVIALIITWLILSTDGMQGAYNDAKNARVGASIIDSVMIDSASGNQSEQPTPNLQNAEDSMLLGMSEPQHLDSTDNVAKEDNTGSHTFEETTGSDTSSPMPGQSGSVLNEVVKGQLGMYAASIYFAVLFMGIFISAGIIPSMMEKGNIDLLVSKPISRVVLLFGRAAGGFFALAANILAFVIAVCALFANASGVWHAPFIYWTVGIPLFGFMVLYSGIILLNVLTEGAVLPMIIAYIHLMILSTFLSSRQSLLYQFIESTFVRSLLDGLHYILPQTSDLLAMLPQAIFTGRLPETEPFLQGAIFAVVMLGLAAWRFSRKDF